MPGLPMGKIYWRGLILKADRRCRALAKLAYQVLDGEVLAAEFSERKKRLLRTSEGL
jgi:hypothetical protein